MSASRRVIPRDAFVLPIWRSVPGHSFRRGAERFYTPTRWGGAGVETIAEHGSRVENGAEKPAERFIPPGVNGAEDFAAGPSPLEMGAEKPAEDFQGEAATASIDAVALETGAEEPAETFQWVRKSAAAGALGVSERTIQNMVARGELRRRLRPDGAVEIAIPRPTQDLARTQATQMVAVYNEALAAQLSPLMARVEDLAGQNGELRAENAALRARVQELEERKQRPWWRRWG